MVLEQLLGLQPSAVKTKDEEEEENQAILQRPLEICLKHSTIHTPDASKCPLVQLQPGVAALHEYADWITELNEKQGNRDRKRTTVNACMTGPITQSLKLMWLVVFLTSSSGSVV